MYIITEKGVTSFNGCGHISVIEYKNGDRTFFNLYMEMGSASIKYYSNGPKHYDDRILIKHYGENASLADEALELIISAIKDGRSFIEI